MVKDKPCPKCPKFREAVKRFNAWGRGAKDEISRLEKANRDLRKRVKELEAARDSVGGEEEREWRWGATGSDDNGDVGSVGRESRAADEYASGVENGHADGRKEVVQRKRKRVVASDEETEEPPPPPSRPPPSPAASKRVKAAVESEQDVSPREPSMNQNWRPSAADSIYDRHNGVKGCTFTDQASFAQGYKRLRGLQPEEAAAVLVDRQDARAFEASELLPALIAHCRERLKAWSQQQFDLSKAPRMQKVMEDMQGLVNLLLGVTSLSCDCNYVDGVLEALKGDLAFCMSFKDCGHFMHMRGGQKHPKVDVPTESVTAAAEEGEEKEGEVAAATAAAAAAAATRPGGAYDGVGSIVDAMASARADIDDELTSSDDDSENEEEATAATSSSGHNGQSATTGKDGLECAEESDDEGLDQLLDEVVNGEEEEEEEEEEEGDKKDKKQELGEEKEHREEDEKDGDEEMKAVCAKEKGAEEEGRSHCPWWDKASKSTKHGWLLCTLLGALLAVAPDGLDRGRRLLRDIVSGGSLSLPSASPRVHTTFVVALVEAWPQLLHAETQRVSLCRGVGTLLTWKALVAGVLPSEESIRQTEEPMLERLQSLCRLPALPAKEEGEDPESTAQLVETLLGLVAQCHDPLGRTAPPCPLCEGSSSEDVSRTEGAAIAEEIRSSMMMLLRCGGSKATPSKWLSSLPFSSCGGGGGGGEDTSSSMTRRACPALQGLLYHVTASLIATSHERKEPGADKYLSALKSAAGLSLSSGESEETESAPPRELQEGDEYCRAQAGLALCEMAEVAGDAQDQTIHRIAGLYSGRDVDEPPGVTAAALLRKVIHIHQRPQAHVISLKRRAHDRLGPALARGVRQGVRLNLVRAVDGQELASGVDKVPLSDVQETWHTAANSRYDRFCIPDILARMDPSERACAASHLSVWRSHAQKRLAPFMPSLAADTVLVLEDDAVLEPGFVRQVTQLLSPTEGGKGGGGTSDWDVCFLGYALPDHGHSRPGFKKKANDRAKAKMYRAEYFARPALNTVKWTWQLHAYLLTRKGAEQLISHLPISAPVDIHMATLLQDTELRGVVSVPRLAVQSHKWSEQEDVKSSGLVRQRRTKGRDEDAQEGGGCWEEQGGMGLFDTEKELRQGSKRDGTEQPFGSAAAAAEDESHQEEEGTGFDSDCE